MSDQANGLLSPWLRRKRFAKVMPHMIGKVLDFGCGIGEFSKHCNPKRYLGFDVDKASLETARRKHPEFTFSEEIRATEKFDTIVLLAVLEHLKEPESILKELGRKLEPKGRIILTTPCSIARFFHTIGAHLGLFSRDASEEHHRLLDYADVSKIGRAHV
jgi:2-polyprenyl-3-methyl-5-hydroxy-6-metoxy-1,4-benzoquinol methylase